MVTYKIKLLMVWFALLVLSGCTSNPVIQDYASQTQFSNYQTYQWLTSSESTHKTLQRQPFIKQRIEQAIIKNLTQRGALIVRQQPQAYISYGYEIFRTETLEPRTTLGLGWGYRHFGFRTAFPLDYETQVYEEVEWSVNIYDANKKLIWQGKTLKPLKSFKNPLEAEAYTQEIINAILNSFPPK